MHERINTSKGVIMSFKPTYLYVKTHNITGLRYFGKATGKEPTKYRGSGKYWLRHLKMHGNFISTEIIGFFQDEEECVRAATEFSKQNNIVESEEWANLKDENGLDGGSDKGHRKKDTSKMKIAAKLRSRNLLENGTHNFQGERGSILAKERNEKLISNGDHNFQGVVGSEHSTKLNRKRVENGTHNLLKRSDGSSIASDRVSLGTHNWQQLNKNTVACVDEYGEFIRIPTEMFWLQSGPKESWKYVGHTSKIAKKRIADKSLVTASVT